MPSARRPQLPTQYDQKESGKAQAKNAAVATAIIKRKVGTAPSLSVIRVASRAPARYPAKLAAPRYTVDEAEYQWDAIKAGISGV